MDDSVVHFLDNVMPLKDLEILPEDILDFKTQVVDAAIRPKADEFRYSLAKQDAGGPNTSGSTGAPADSDVNVEMSTIMEGFRYLKNEIYPVAKDNQLVENYPVIPIGMLTIWREQDNEANIDSFLQMQ